MVTHVRQEFTQGPGRHDGHAADGTPGDCTRACVASLLETDPQNVPHFVVYVDWLAELSRWALDHGLLALWINPTQIDDGVIDDFGVGEYAIAAGPSPRGPFWHDVVIRTRDLTVAWDPHPSGAGILEICEILALVPAEPWLVAVSGALGIPPRARLASSWGRWPATVGVWRTAYTRTIVDPARIAAQIPLYRPEANL